MIDQTDKQISVVATIKKLIDEENDESHVCYSQKETSSTADFQVRLL
jgi:hypothetical protein